MPAYVPVVRGGGKMHVRMLCLGRHWNGKTYRYEATRTDFDDLPAPPLPASIPRARERYRARRPGWRSTPDLCILNYYDADGRMGLHQDKDESERSIAAGLPVVSVSLGDTARFLFGGLRRRDPVEASRSNPATRSSSADRRACGITASRASCPGPRRPSSDLTGRFNLTFRQF